jgi:hypothetical protein
MARITKLNNLDLRNHYSLYMLTLSLLINNMSVQQSTKEERKTYCQSNIRNKRIVHIDQVMWQQLT